MSPMEITDIDTGLLVAAVWRDLGIAVALGVVLLDVRNSFAHPQLDQSLQRSSAQEQVDEGRAPQV